MDVMDTESDFFFPLDTTWPEWAAQIAVDQDGSVWVFEGGCYFSPKGHWIPVDDFDGLRFEQIGQVPPLSVEVAKTLRFTRQFPVETEPLNPNELIALPQARAEHGG